MRLPVTSHNTLLRHIAAPALLWAFLAIVVSLLSLDFRWFTWGDEVVYFSVADSLLHTGKPLYHGGLQEDIPIILYSAAIAPAFLFKDALLASIAARVLNAFYFTSVIFPVFFIARWVMPCRRALVVAGLAALVGEVHYTGLILAENLYYPLFYWLILAVARLLTYRGWWNATAAVVTGVAAYLTKSSALAPCIAAVLSLATSMLLEYREHGRGWRATYWVALALVAIAGVAVAELIRWRIAVGLPPLPYWEVFGQLANTIISLRPGDLALWEARSMGLVGLLAGGGMLVLALPPLAAALGQDAERDKRSLAIVSIWNLVCVTGLAAWYNGYLAGTLVERHVFMLLPLLLIWAAAKVEQQRFRLLGLVALPLVATVFFVPEYEYFSNGAMFTGLDETKVRAGVAVLVLGVALICGALAWRCRYRTAFLIACAGWLVVNVVLVAPMQYDFYGRESTDHRKRNLPVVQAMCDIMKRPANIFFHSGPATERKDWIITDYDYFCRDFLSVINPDVPLSGRPFYTVVDRGAPPLKPQAPWVKLESIGGVDIYRRNP